MKPMIRPTEPPRMAPIFPVEKVRLLYQENVVSEDGDEVELERMENHPATYICQKLWGHEVAG